MNSRCRISIKLEHDELSKARKVEKTGGSTDSLIDFNKFFKITLIRRLTIYFFYFDVFCHN